MMKNKLFGRHVVKTTNDFGSVSSIHGMFYILSSGIPWIDRFIWTFLVILSIVLAALLCTQSDENWKENPVMTSLEDTSRSISSLKWPAITICSEGLNMVAVDRVIQRNFEIWKQNNKRKKREIGCTNEKELFLKDKFKILAKNQNIFNIIKTFFVHNVDTFIENDGLRENLLACRETGDKKLSSYPKRTKRSTSACEGATLSEPVFCSMSSYTASQFCNCGKYGKVLKMESKHSNTYEDRTWKLTCENIPQYKSAQTGLRRGSLLSDWEISPYLDNAFVNGLSSGFNRWKKDRWYKVRWSKNIIFTVGDCGDWKQKSDWDDILVGPLESDEVIGAIKSKFLSANLDREFHVKICKISSQCE